MRTRAFLHSVSRNVNVPKKKHGKGAKHALNVRYTFFTCLKIFEIIEQECERVLELSYSAVDRGLRNTVTVEGEKHEAES
jgi:hypothetical protein